MYTGLLHTHSSLRYILLILLLVVLAKSLVGLINNKPFEKIDGKLTLWSMIAAHVQLLAGLALYGVSPVVKFGADTMKDSVLRYWAVEHFTIMLIAIVLITLARTSTKKLASDKAKHKRVFVFTGVALALILLAIVMSGRGILIPVRA